MDNRLTIGFIASGHRTIRDGRDYDRFFALPDGNDRIVREGDVYETVDLMKRVVWKYIDDTRDIARHLKGNTLKNTCENTWKFLYHHIQYQLDKRGLEQLRRPARSWAERKSGIDCDCFSIFVSSILTNLQIPHLLRITQYEKGVYQHVYVAVPVKGGDGEYIIDCVLGRFNYEKPYTAKKNFPMSLDKINIAVLSGVDTDVLEVISGLTGLDEGELSGTGGEEQRSQAIYQHMVKTRNLIAQKPYLIAQVDYPPAFLQMLDYAIAAWHTPNRGAALENLSRNEEVLNRLNGMDGLPDNTELDGTDDLWAHLDTLSLGEIREELCGRARKEKRKAARAERKKNKKGFFRKVGQAMTKGVKAIVRFNPLSIAARNGFLLFLKLNVKKVASRLKWGYATREQAAAKGVSVQGWERSKNALAKMEHLFADKLQGKKSALKNAILRGRAGGLSGTGGDEEVGLTGLGVAPAAAMAAALPVITAALKIMSDAGLMKQSETQEVESDLNVKAAEAENLSPGQEQAPVAQDISLPMPTPQSSAPSYTPDAAPSETPGQEVPLPEEDSLTSENVPAIIPESAAEPEPTAPESADSWEDIPGEPTEEVPPDNQQTAMDGMMDFVQSKPLLIAGGVALGLWGLYMLLGRNKPSSAKGFSGLSVGEKKKKKKAPLQPPRHKPARGKKIKAITLQ